MDKKRIYFPGLNGVRFIAVLLVLLDHLELFKNYFGFKTLWTPAYSSYLGSAGVTIFFVLSGYLITYLLLTEKKESGIKIKNFYIRRILRIWPLYYLIIIISFFIAPSIAFLKVPGYGEDIRIYFSEKLLLFSAFFANVAFVYLPTVAFANVLWSVAVEEQFYLLWPAILKIFKSTLAALLTLLIIYLAVKVFVFINLLNIKKDLPVNIDELISRTRISCMIIGALGALALFKKISALQFLYSKYVQCISLAIFFILLFDLVNLHYFFLVKNEVISCAVVVMLINISSNPYSVLKLKNRYLDYLGKISYGIYVYHLFTIVVCIKLFALISPETTLTYIFWNIGLLLAVGFLTVVISHLSYKYFESNFLKKKIKYSVILSGDMVQNTEISK